MSDELVPYLDRRFDEAARRLEALHEETGHRFDGVDARLEQVDRRFDGVDARFEEVDRRFDAVDARLEQVDRRFDGVDGRLEGIDARLDAVEAQVRQGQVVVEQLRSDLQAVAEGVVTVDGKLEQQRREMAQGFSEVQALLRLSYSQLESRVSQLEAKVERLDSRLSSLEAGDPPSLS